MRRHTTVLLACLLAATLAAAADPCYPVTYTTPPTEARVLVGVQAAADEVAAAKAWRVDAGPTRRLEVYGQAATDGGVIFGWAPAPGGKAVAPMYCPVEFPGYFVREHLIGDLWPGLEGTGTVWAYAVDLAGDPAPLAMTGTEYTCSVAGLCRGAVVPELVLPAAEWRLLPVPPGASFLELSVYNPGPAITTLAVGDEWFMVLPVSLQPETMTVSLEGIDLPFLPLCAGCTPPWPIGGWQPQALPIGATFHGSVAVRGTVLPEPR